MKHLLLTTIAAVVLLGCGDSQQSAPPVNQEANNALLEAAVLGTIQAVRYQLAAGADVSAKGDRFGTTALHYAAKYGHKEIAELLIAKGSDVNVNGGVFGLTPLHFAAREGHRETAVLLIENGADVNAKDENGWTPLDATQIFPKTADLLRKNGGMKGKDLR